MRYCHTIRSTTLRCCCISIMFSIVSTYRSNRSKIVKNGNQYLVSHSAIGDKTYVHAIQGDDDIGLSYTFILWGSGDLLVLLVSALPGVMIPPHYISWPAFLDWLDTSNSGSNLWFPSVQQSLLKSIKTFKRCTSGGSELVSLTIPKSSPFLWLGFETISKVWQPGWVPYYLIHLMKTRSQ